MVFAQLHVFIYSFYWNYFLNLLFCLSTSLFFTAIKIESQKLEMILGNRTAQNFLTGFWSRLK